MSSQIVKRSVYNCENVMELTKWREKEKLLQFLFGLDTAIFRMIRSSILGEDPLPNINQAYSKVMQEEQVKNMTKG